MGQDLDIRSHNGSKINIRDIKKFDIPIFYRSPFTGRIKEARRMEDPRKKDFTPTELHFGPVTFIIARHFGFCYGVENAIEISYKAVEENPGKRVFLLSQMIHNQLVNNDLESRGVSFIMDTDGSQLIPWEELHADDIVIIPAFGTTLEIEEKLRSLGLEVQRYNTTCPFVEKVWKRSEKLGTDEFSVIIHGKHNHEETRATFSHSKSSAPSLIIRDIEETKVLADFILGKIKEEVFYRIFEGRMSHGFNPGIHLDRIGVVNQTTMLASETQAIADYLKQTMIEKFGIEESKKHFADTRDTLCYATNDNQEATYSLLESNADIAIVVGGYNSSNTSHIVELLERKYPTYFISSEKEINSPGEIRHFDYQEKKIITTKNFLPANRPARIIITSGASCPDTVVDGVLQKLLGYFESDISIETAVSKITNSGN